MRSLAQLKAISFSKFLPVDLNGPPVHRFNSEVFHFILFEFFFCKQGSQIRIVLSSFKADIAAE